MNIMILSVLILVLGGCMIYLFIPRKNPGAYRVENTPSSSNYLKTIPSQYLRTRRFDIHYISQGKGDPVILIHGGGMWLYSYRDNIPELSRTFTVYALDMPGYGYTVPRANSPRYGLSVMADTLLEFMDALKIKKASLVGHSWGGGWAIHFAHKHPERVDKLCLIDSSGLDVRDILEWELLKYPIIGACLVRCISSHGVRQRLERSFFNKNHVTSEMVNEVYTPMRFRTNRKAQSLLSRNQDWQQTQKSMHEIHNAVLLIWGDSDYYLDPNLAKKFAVRFANIKTIILKNCGHSAHEEYPDVVNNLIMEFLKQDAAESK